MRLGLLETMRLVTAMTAAAVVAACSGGQDNSIEPTPTIEITLTPTTATVVQGANTTANLLLTRAGGFTGEVAVAFEGLPAGVTPAAAPATLGSSVTSSVLTFTASATAATGTANVTVRATGTGVTAKTATIALTVNAAPSFSLAATATTVAAGGTGTSNITITRAGGFAGAVTLAAEGLPAGVTAVFNPNNTTTNASVLTFTAGANAAAGTSTITVRGTAAGQTDKTTTLQLTVTAPPGGFTLALQPTALPVQQGAAGNTTVTITRTNGFAGPVNLTATGLPNGVTAAFEPAATTANTSTLTLTASGTAAVGQATVTVRGNATGITEQTTTLTLTVTQAVGGSGNTTWEFCTASQTPLWLAIQHLATDFAFPSPTMTDQFRYGGLYFKDPTDRTVTPRSALTAPTVSAAATTPYARFRTTGPIQT